jgi:hypothetical protein
MGSLNILFTRLLDIETKIDHLKGADPRKASKNKEEWDYLKKRRAHVMTQIDKLGNNYTIIEVSLSDSSKIYFTGITEQDAKDLMRFKYKSLVPIQFRKIYPGEIIT